MSAFPRIPENAKGIKLPVRDEPLYRCSAFGGHYAPRSAFHANAANRRGFHYYCKTCAQEIRGTKKPRIKREPDATDTLVCRSCGKRKVSTQFAFYRNRWDSRCRPCNNARKNTERKKRLAQDETYLNHRRKQWRKGDDKRTQKSIQYRKDKREEIAALVNVLRTRGYSLTRLGTICGIHPDTLSRWINPADERVPDRPPLDRAYAALADEILRLDFGPLDKR